RDQRLVEIPVVGRGDGVRPDEVTGRGVAGDLACAPVVAVVDQAAILVEVNDAPLTAIVGVPRAAIAGRVVEDVVILVPGEIAPGGAAATTPGVAIPGGERG